MSNIIQCIRVRSACSSRQPVGGQVMAALCSGCRCTGAAAEFKQAKEAGIKKKDENIFEKVKILRKFQVNLWILSVKLSPSSKHLFQGLSRTAYLSDSLVLKGQAWKMRMKWWNKPVFVEAPKPSSKPYEIPCNPVHPARNWSCTGQNRTVECLKV